MLLWTMYLVGYLLMQAMQIQNSLLSNTNGLEFSWTGIKRWLKISLLQTLIELFIAIILFPAAIQGPLSSLNGLMKANGFALQGWGLAGIAGFSAKAAIYQIIGLIPGLRKEVAQAAPPPEPPKA